MGYVDSDIYRWYCAIFEVGLVLLIPLVFTVAKRANVSILKLGLPMVTALSVTHSSYHHILDPLSSLRSLKANMVKFVIWYDYCYPCNTYCRSNLLIDLHKDGSNSLYERRGYFFFRYSKEFKEEEMPGFGISLLTAILPVILMLISTIVQLITGHEKQQMYSNKLFTS